MIPYRALALFISVGACACACETEDPARAVVDNGYAGVVVYKTWWEVTLFDEPVLPGAASAELRTVPESAVAYALLAPGWDPESGSPPATLIPVQSKQPLAVERGKTLRITVSDATFAGSCAAQQPLSQQDADFITQRIFPGSFANVTYDARTCTTTPIPDEDAGADAAGDAPSL